MNEAYSSNLIIQYSVVGVILLGISIWLFIKIFRTGKKKNGGSCCGCSLYDHCEKVKEKPVFKNSTKEQTKIDCKSDNNPNL